MEVRLQVFERGFQRPAFAVEFSHLLGRHLARHIRQDVDNRRPVSGRFVHLDTQATKDMLVAVRIPYGQKTRNQLDNRVYDPAIAYSAICILSTLSCILGPREGRTNSEGQTHGLEDTARVYHRDRRSRTTVAQRIPGDRESHPAPSAQRARAVE